MPLISLKLKERYHSNGYYQIYKILKKMPMPNFKSKIEKSIKNLITSIAFLKNIVIVCNHFHLNKLFWPLDKTKKQELKPTLNKKLILLYKQTKKKGLDNLNLVCIETRLSILFKEKNPYCDSKM